MASKGIRKAYNGQDYERLKSKMGMVFVPSVQMPMLMLSVLQYMTRGGLEGNEGFDKAIARQFGTEGSGYREFANYLHFFDFEQETERTQAATSVIIGFLLTLQAIFGTEGAFRFILLVFDFVFSNVEVTVDPSEPVASLRVIKDKKDYKQGWDTHFPNYHDVVFHTLKNHVRRSEVATYQLHASTGNKWAKSIADMLARTMDTAPASTAYGGELVGYGQWTLDAVETEAKPSMVWMLTGLTDGLTGEVLRANPVLATISEQEKMHGYGGTPFGGLLDQLQGSELMKPGYWPVAGGSASMIDRLDPIQRHGVERSQPVMTAGGMRVYKYKHSGLDIPAATGTAVHSIYPGTVTKVVTDWSKEKHGDDPAHSRGNYVRVAYEGPAGQPLPGGARLVVDYMHLKSAAVEVGDTLTRGQQLGEVNSTGNSTGPHLHIEMRWVIQGQHGRDTRSWLLNAETVLQEGALHAAREAGAPLNVTRPILGAASWTLGTIANPAAQAPPVYGGWLDTLKGGVRSIFDKLDDVTEEAGEAIREAVGDKIYDTVRKEVIEITDDVLNWADGPGAGTVRTIARTVGLDDYADSIVDVLNASWDRGASDGEFNSSDMFEAGVQQTLRELREAKVPENLIKSFIESIRKEHGLGGLFS